MRNQTIATWHELVRSRDTQGLAGLLADDVVFHSPVVHTPQAGKAVTTQYLAAAFHVFCNESFRYVREVAGSHDAVLEFQVVGRDEISEHHQEARRRIGRRAV
ncbi:MAG: nuclear transport factor 2 family protein [Steroidobacteraceae bacterium]